MNRHFLCIGAQKSATSTLYDLLKNHPEISKSSHKEIHFFDAFNYADLDINVYESYFDNLELILSDITPSYIYLPYVPERIHNALGSSIKILAILRNPIDRAKSHYLMTKRRGLENLSFEEAYYEEGNRIKKNEQNLKDYSYFDRGLYYKQLKRYYDLFPEENIKVISFEEFVSDQTKVLNDICDFIGISHIEIPKFKHRNKSFVPRSYTLNRFLFKMTFLLRKTWLRKLGFLSRWKRAIIQRNKSSRTDNVTITNDFRRILNEFYADDKKKLHELTNIDISNWR